MEPEKIEKVIKDIVAIVGDKASKIIEENRRAAVRIDAMMELMRQAVEASSLGAYNGVTHCFTGKIYEPMTYDEFSLVIYHCVRRLGLPNGDYGRLRTLKDLCRATVMNKELRINKEIIVFNNCVYDLSTHSRRKFSPKFVQVCQMDYDFDPTEEYSLLWQTFLDRVLPKKMMQKVLQEFLGAIFINRAKAKIENMLILLGPGQNGKGVVFEVIDGILGRDNITNVPLGELMGGYDKKKNIASINGKKLNYCTEIGAFAIGKGSDTLKQLISGEPVQAREMYGNNFTARDIPLFIVNANALPDLQDVSLGMRRRLIIIPFDQVITEDEKNLTLAQELMQERSAIFNWLMEGRERYMRQGYKFTSVKELEEIVDEYHYSSNSVLNFMHSQRYYRSFEAAKMLKPAPISAEPEPLWVESKRIFDKYCVWCHSNGIIPVNITAFGRTLSKAGFLKRRLSQGNMVGIYSSANTMAVMSRKAEEKALKARQKKAKTKRGQNMIPYYDRKTGHRLVRSMRGLAAEIRLPMSMLERAAQKGLFDKFTKTLDKTQRGCSKCFDINLIKENIGSLLASTEALHRKVQSQKTIWLKDLADED